MSVATGIVLGWGADRVLGDPARAHPVAAVGAAAERLERVLWRDRVVAGAVHAALVLAVVAVPLAALDRRLRERRAARVAVAALTVWACLGGRSLRREAADLAAALAAGDVVNARARLPRLCGRDPAGLDATALARATVESVAENTADAVAGTLLWAAVAGPAGAAAHRVANTLDAMVGQRTRRYARFGSGAAHLDDLLGWLPARATAWAAVALAGTVGGSPATAAAVLRRDGRRHPSPNAGPCEAAFAGALGRELGGAVNRYGDHVDARPAQGQGPPPGAHDVRRAVVLAARVEGALLALAVLLASARGAPARGGRR